MATAVRNVVRRTRSRLIPSTPTWYSAPSQPIQGVRSVNCIPGTSRRKPPYSVSDTRNVATDTAKARCLMADSRCRSRQRRRATPASGKKVTMETMGIEETGLTTVVDRFLLDTQEPGACGACQALRRMGYVAADHPGC